MLVYLNGIVISFIGSFFWKYVEMGEEILKFF